MILSHVTSDYDSQPPEIGYYVVDDMILTIFFDSDLKVADWHVESAKKIEVDLPKELLEAMEEIRKDPNIKRATFRLA